MSMGEEMLDPKRRHVYTKKTNDATWTIENFDIYFKAKYPGHTTIE
jgi:hypothetical protein